MHGADHISERSFGQIPRVRFMIVPPAVEKFQN
jgi:hypothetical protein